MKELFGRLKECGWKIDQDNLVTLPIHIRKRYRNLSERTVEYLGSFSSCVDPTNTKWLLSSIDYMEDKGEGFSWSEFESMSLEAVGSDDNSRQEITNFWDYHLPIFMSVDGFYEYLAIDVSRKTPERFVLGFEPEFEEPLEFANGYDDFSVKFLEHVKCT